MDKLFVYGIFLSEGSRQRYGMHNPQYDTVQGYATFGSHIVEALPVRNQEAALTGLIVDVDPSRWADIDAVEYGYERKEITTVTGEQAYMYVGKE